MLFASTFAFMWRMMSSTLSEMDKKPVKSYGDAMKPYKMPAPHPEMEGVKTGEELLVYTPEDEEDDDWFKDYKRRKKRIFIDYS